MQIEPRKALSRAEARPRGAMLNTPAPGHAVGIGRDLANAYGSSSVTRGPAAVGSLPPRPLLPSPMLPYPGPADIATGTRTAAAGPAAVTVTDPPAAPLPAPDQPAQSRKLFIGGVSQLTTDENFYKYFEQFGQIEEAMLMYDKLTHRQRGFGFVTFRSVDAVTRVLRQAVHEIDGKCVRCCRKCAPASAPRWR